MITNARSLAKLGAYMANKGTFQGKELMTEDAWNQLHAEPKSGSLGGCGLDNTVSFTKGGIW
jgi:hypothetical protein